MHRKSRNFLLLLAAAVAAVVLYDVVQPEEPPVTQPPPAAPPAAPAPRPLRRVLDKTPLLYPGEYLQNLLGRVGPALVTAGPASDASRRAARAVRVGETLVLVPLPADLPHWQLSNGDEVQRAALVGIDMIHGVALLRSEAAASVFVDPGELGAVASGEPLVALGASPNGAYSRFLTSPGTLEQLRDALAKERLEPGEIVVDLDGRLVAFAAWTTDGVEPLLGQQVSEIVRAIARDGVHPHPWTGLTLQEVGSSLRPHFPQGELVVVHVEPGSPAAEAGVRVGSTFAEVVSGDLRASTAAEVQAILRIGADLTLVPDRPLQPEIKVGVIDLQTPPPFHTSAAGSGLLPGGAPPPGVPVVVRPGSAAALLGVQTGDLVVAVNLREVRTTAQLDRALALKTPNVLTVRRGKDHFMVAMPGDGDAPVLAVLSGAAAR
jgi:S1-C subfamily serine protease